MLRHICRLLGWEGRNAFVKLARRSPEQRYPWQQKGSGEIWQHLSDSRPGNEFDSARSHSTSTLPDAAEPEANRKELAALFTCGVCDTRVAKTFSRRSYEQGVVLVKCPSCNNLHVLADRLGWFGEPGSAESFLAEQGQEVRSKAFSADGTCELTSEDIQGWSHGNGDPVGTR